MKCERIGKQRAPEGQATRRILSIVCATLLAMVALARPVHAKRVMPPPVPAEIQVPAGNEAFLEGHAVGTQDYLCLPEGGGFAWILLGPRATLFNDHDRQLITHFLSPNPLEGETPRVTWQHSRDTSSVWGSAIATSSDPAFVAPAAVAWLLVQVVGAQDGPTGGHRLSATTFIQRLNTSGGIEPATGCAQSTDVGKKALVPYTADYFFYK